MVILGHSHRPRGSFREGLGLPSFSRESWSTRQLEDLELARGGWDFTFQFLGVQCTVHSRHGQRGPDIFPP